MWLETGKTVLNLTLALALLWLAIRLSKSVASSTGSFHDSFWNPVPPRLLRAVQAVTIVIVGAAVALILWIGMIPLAGRLAADRAVILAELGVASLWLAPIFCMARARGREPRHRVDRWLRSIRDARTLVYGGLLVQAGLPAVAIALRGCTPVADSLRRVSSICGASVLAAGLFVSGLYSVLGMGSRAAAPYNPPRDSKNGLARAREPSVSGRRGILIRHFVAFMPATIIFAAVPFFDNFCMNVRRPDAILFSEIVRGSKVCTSGAVFDLNFGIVYGAVLATTALSGLVLSGTSNCRASWKSRLRSAAQSSLVPLIEATALLGPLAICSTLNLRAAVQWQSFHTWGVFVQPIAFALFLATRASVRPAEQRQDDDSLAVGSAAEPSRPMDVLQLAEYAYVVASSALLCTLFLGGWNVPFLDGRGIRVEFTGHILFRLRMSELTATSLGVISMVTKVAIVVWIQTRGRVFSAAHKAVTWLRQRQSWLLIAAMGNVVLTKLIVAIVSSSGPLYGSTLRLLCQLSMALVAVLSVVVMVLLARALALPVGSSRARPPPYAQ